MYLPPCICGDFWIKMDNILFLFTSELIRTKCRLKVNLLRQFWTASMNHHRDKSWRHSFVRIKSSWSTPRSVLASRCAKKPWLAPSIQKRCERRRLFTRHLTWIIYVQLDADFIRAIMVIFKHNWSDRLFILVTFQAKMLSILLLAS